MTHLATWVSATSLAIAFLALISTALQAGRIARLTRNSHQIMVTAEVFREIRSAEFLDHYRRILSLSPSQVASGGVESFDDSLRDSIYAVAYFFEHLGVLVTRRLIDGEVLISTMRTLIIRSWATLEPAIEAELAFRRAACPEYAGRDFVPHFRRLVALARNQATASQPISAPAEGIQATTPAEAQSASFATVPTALPTPPASAGQEN